MSERPYDEASTVHPHEPRIPPILRADGGCLVCELGVAAWDWSVAWLSEHSLRLEAEARAERAEARVKELEGWFREAVEEFEDARGYANDYFTEKWGYDETSARFAATIAALETGGEG